MPTCSTLITRMQQDRGQHRRPSSPSSNNHRGRTLLDWLRRRDWARPARPNGPAYATATNYDLKLAGALCACGSAAADA